MSMAVSGVKDADSINFGASVLSNSSPWVKASGDVTFGNTIKLGPDSSCKITLGMENIKCTYIKLTARVTCADTSISTDSFHLFGAHYKINYTDNSGKSVTKVDSYFPKYVFEDTYENDYVIIAVPDFSIGNIEIELVNKELIPVEVLVTGLQYSKIVDEQYMKVYITENVGGVIEDSLINNTMDLVIPLINDISELNNKPDGTIVRCSWIGGVV